MARRRNPGDVRLRKLERAAFAGGPEEKSFFLAEWLRKGRIKKSTIELCAYMGNEASQWLLRRMWDPLFDEIVMKGLSVNLRDRVSSYREIQLPEGETLIQWTPEEAAICSVALFLNNTSKTFTVEWIKTAFRAVLDPPPWLKHKRKWTASLEEARQSFTILDAIKKMPQRGSLKSQDLALLAWGHGGHGLEPRQSEFLAVDFSSLLEVMRIPWRNRSEFRSQFLADEYVSRQDLKGFRLHATFDALDWYWKSHKAPEGKPLGKKRMRTVVSFAYTLLLDLTVELRSKHKAKDRWRDTEPKLLKAMTRYYLPEAAW